MRILVACEYSGKVRDAFIKRGHRPGNGGSMELRTNGVACLKTCLICRATFTPRRMGQKTCSPICEKERKRQRRIDNERKLAIKPRAQWLKDAERSCNAYIRARDRHCVCISCGRQLGESFHAGHFRSVGAASHLRFNELNVHGQCAKCNTYNGGNLLGYRKGLAERCGADLVDYLENYNAPARWTIEECKEVIEYYKAKMIEINAEKRPR